MVEIEKPKLQLSSRRSGPSGFLQEFIVHERKEVRELTVNSWSTVSFKTNVELFRTAVYVRRIRCPRRLQPTGATRAVIV